MSMILFLTEPQIELVVVALNMLDGKLSTTEAALASSNAKDSFGSRRRAVRMDRQTLAGLLADIQKQGRSDSSGSSNAASTSGMIDDTGAEETPTP